MGDLVTPKVWAKFAMVISAVGIWIGGVTVLDGASWPVIITFVAGCYPVGLGVGWVIKQYGSESWPRRF